MLDVLVIGAGPAGLMAAEELAKAGRGVVVIEAKPSAGRKFLMAGKSGLNLTKDEPIETLLVSYGKAAPVLRPILTNFDAEAVKSWARALDQEVFTGTSGRVFPKAMKASPLLRAWMARLAEMGVELRTRWRWTGWTDEGFVFATPAGETVLRPKATVLALGGASWSRLGSNGAWAKILADRGIDCAPFKPANVGLTVDWSDHMTRHFGAPIKNVAFIAGEVRTRGEAVISARGLEGGGIYTASKAVRDGAPLAIDLLPDWSLQTVVDRLVRPRGKENMSNFLRKALKLDPVRLALLQEFGRPLPTEPAFLARLVKHLPIAHTGVRPLDEAISTAGGVSFDVLDENLMLRSAPGVFCAGEMLDWEAPTGGYLLTACFATGRWAGIAASRYQPQ